MPDTNDPQIPAVTRTSTLEEAPAADPRPAPPRQVLEEAYFHINNGGLTLSIALEGEGKHRHLTLEGRASHFGRGLEVSLPMLSREMLAWVAEAAARTSQHLAKADVSLSFSEGHDSLKPQYSVVKGQPVPRRYVRHETSGPGFAAMHSEDKSAEVVAEMLAADKPASPWIRTADRLPEIPEGSTCSHAWVLAYHNGEQKVLPYNPYHKCWDDESGDDYMCGPLEVTHWMPLPNDPE